MHNYFVSSFLVLFFAFHCWLITITHHVDMSSRGGCKQARSYIQFLLIFLLIFFSFIFRSNILISIQGESDSCKTEQFRVLDDGTNQIMERGTYYCGQGPITFESRANFITFGKDPNRSIIIINSKPIKQFHLFVSGHTSTFYSGRYNCTVLAMYRKQNRLPISIT